MSTNNFEALIIGTTDCGEADRVVRLLTRQGRASVFAHAAKKSQRRFLGALEPFTSIRASIKPSRRGRAGMPTLESAVVSRARLGIREDLLRLGCAAHIAELSGRVAPEDDPSEALFSLAEAGLDRLDRGPASAVVRAAFELRLLAVLGFSPVLDRCSICSKQLPSAAFVDFRRGGLLCEGDAAQAGPIGPKTRAFAVAVLASSSFDESFGADPDTAERAALKLAKPLAEIYESLLTRPLKSARFAQHSSA